MNVDNEPLPYNDDSLNESAIQVLSNSQKRRLNPWSHIEDIRLYAGITKYGLDNWLAISKFVGNGRTRAQCSQRWNRCLDPHLKKCRWTEAEEEKLQELIKKHGLKAWTLISQNLGNRSDVQCRYHYNQMKKQNRAFINKAPSLPMTHIPTPSLPSISTSSSVGVVNSINQIVALNNTFNPVNIPNTNNNVRIPAPPVESKNINNNPVSLNLPMNAPRNIPDVIQEITPVPPKKDDVKPVSNDTDSWLFDDCWNVSCSTNELNDDLIFAFDQSNMFMGFSPFLEIPE